MTTDGKATFFEFPEPDQQSWLVGRGRDDNAWFLEMRRGHVGFVDEAGRLTEFSLRAKHSLGVEAHPAIVRGPDGATWFVESEAGKIGRIGCAKGAA